MILEAALEIHRSGLWVTICCPSSHPPGQCVISRKIPCTSPGKAPMHGQYQKVRLTEQQIESWLVRFPDANLGACLGPTGGVIDAETDTPEQESTLMSILDDCGLGDLQVPPMWYSGYHDETARQINFRGRHRLFKFSDELPKTASIEVNGVLFKIGVGGLASQSIIPPSRHKSGVVYQWATGCTIAETDPPPIPAKLIELLNQAHASRKKPKQTARYSGCRSRTDTDGVYTPGNRHEALRTVICRLHGYGEPVETIRDFAHAWNRLHCSPPYEPHVIDAQVDDLTRRYPPGTRRNFQAAMPSSGRMFGSVPMDCYR